MPLDKEYPVGSPVVDNVHSVCVSLPTMADVCGYEEKKPEVVNAMRSGYPRFREHDLVAELRQRFRERHQLKAQHILPVVSDKAATDLLKFLDQEDGVIYPETGFVIVHFDADEAVEKKARSFLQHTGTMISSRQAEDWLVHNGYREAVFAEQTVETDALKHVRKTLSPWLNDAEMGDILLCTSGMNAVYAAFKAVNKAQKAKGRDLWIQLGWLYLDTTCILTKFADKSEDVTLFYDVTDLDALEAFLEEKGEQVAGLITEVPTNPLIQTVDLERLRSLTEKYGIVLILDPSISSVYNIDILPYADVLVLSLTKYTASAGDVMIGAAVMNRDSSFYAELKPGLIECCSVPYERDVARLAYQIGFCEEVFEEINPNTCKVARFLEHHPAVKEVFWAYRHDTADQYRKYAKREAAPGGIITFFLRGSLTKFYDSSKIVKSPSFGTHFTMMCPFMYLAHYDLVTDPAKNAELSKLGVEAELIRLSVGTEDINDIIADLQQALEKSM